MARFYFHLATGDDYHRDEIGSDHVSANEAYLAAFETFAMKSSLPAPSWRTSGPS